jgi:multimeric flavodoxin WrbA
MKRLLIVWHSHTGAARQMSEALERGARRIAAELDQNQNVHIERRAADTVTPHHDVLTSDTYLFCAPENLASLSGEIKAFFDRCYYPVLDRIAGRPYAVAISAGTDGCGAARQTEKICTGWRLRAIAPPLIVRNGAQTPEQIAAEKTVTQEVLQQCEKLGGTLSATLLL